MRNLIYLSAALSLFFFASPVKSTNSIPLGGLTLTYDGGDWVDANTVILDVNEVLEIGLELDEGHSSLGGGIDFILDNSAAEFVTDGGYGYGPVEFLCNYCMIQEVQVDSPQAVTLYYDNDFCGTVWGHCVIMQNLLVHSLDAKTVELNIVAKMIQLDTGTIPGGTILHTVQILPKIELLTPNGGETLVAGNAYEINWSSIPDIINILIEYSINNGQDWAPVDPPNVGNTGLYNWDPIPFADSNQCLVKVSDEDDMDVFDISDGLFTIFECQNPIVGDLNLDCYVDFLDLAIFGNNWLECGNPFDPDCSF